MPWASGMLLGGPWRAALGPRVPTQKVTSHFSAQLNEWICGALGRLVAAFVKLACMTPFCAVCGPLCLKHLPQNAQTFLGLRQAGWPGQGSSTCRGAGAGKTKNRWDLLLLWSSVFRSEGKHYFAQ